eukprot:TRINITY_DN4970_c0_g1_i4.p1 TRINITY_DN4970_c0_g1~~TRINITY_DN4970_c0_g1_i4.p1  ORF type:complete len:255 (+),score=5.23 TRINITY_DN4970_c0_g1_i4:80-844(+)
MSSGLDLPDDCLRSIFAQIDAKDLSSCSCVCREWNQITLSDDAIWKRHIDQIPRQFLEDRLFGEGFCVPCHARHEIRSLWRTAGLAGYTFSAVEPWIARGLALAILLQITYSGIDPLALLLGMLVATTYHTHVLALQSIDWIRTFSTYFRVILTTLTVILIVFTSVDTAATDLLITLVLQSETLYVWANKAFIWFDAFHFPQPQRLLRVYAWFNTRISHSYAAVLARVRFFPCPLCSMCFFIFDNTHKKKKRFR